MKKDRILKGSSSKKSRQKSSASQDEVIDALLSSKLDSTSYYSHTDLEKNKPRAFSDLVDDIDTDSKSTRHTVIQADFIVYRHTCERINNPEIKRKP